MLKECTYLTSWRFLPKPAFNLYYCLCVNVDCLSICLHISPKFHYYLLLIVLMSPLYINCAVTKLHIVPFWICHQPTHLIIHNYACTNSLFVNGFLWMVWTWKWRYIFISGWKAFQCALRKVHNWVMQITGELQVYLSVGGVNAMLVKTRY